MRLFAANRLAGRQADAAACSTSGRSWAPACAQPLAPATRRADLPVPSRAAVLTRSASGTIGGPRASPSGVVAPADDGFAYLALDLPPATHTRVKKSEFIKSSAKAGARAW
jgi:hypothetical protein